jgi:CRISPR-associated endonuclease/helicase Cas3
LDVPDRWTAVYDRSLLERTHALLVGRGGRSVRIPEDVQDMVEEVYDESFSATMSDSEMARLIDDETRASLAGMVAIPAPRDVEDLSVLTKKEIAEERVSTRLGADSVRAVCCFVDVDGIRWLDRGLTVSLAETGNGPAGRFTADDVRRILSESIPVRYGPWFDHDRLIVAVPPGWAEHPSLRDLVLLPHPVGSDGVVAPVAVGGYNFILDPTLGLTS